MMKALILAGGSGSRLRPLTYTSAKQLIPVANKPTLFYAIEAIRDAGIRDIGVIVGHTKDEVIEALGDGSRWEVNFTFIEQDAPRGLAHAVMIAEDFIGDTPFLMFLGDNIIRQGVTEFVQNFDTNRPNSLILLSHVPDPSRFGVVELKEGRVVRLVEKPKIPPSDLALVGVYLFDHNIFKAVNAIEPSWRDELEITDAIQWLVSNGYRVDPHIVQGWWKDTGKPGDMLEANRIMLENLDRSVDGEVCEASAIMGQVELHPTAKVIRSTIRGPAIIGPNAVIEDAYVGPFSAIGPEVTISHAEVENSIILDGCQITNVHTRIDAALLGRGVRVESTKARPKAISLVLGDNSHVKLTE
jgi:glucose-1-phosphate thymidylyltransferase